MNSIFQSRPPQPDNYSFMHENKPFNMSYRRLFSIIFVVITVVNTVSITITTLMHLNKMERKEKLELDSFQTYPLTLADSNSTELYRTNRSAYAVAQILYTIGLFVSVSIRLFGLAAIGMFGKEFSDNEYERSDRRESFSGCLFYVGAMIVLFGAYYVGMVRMWPFDAFLHCLLIAIGILFLAFSIQEQEEYSKEVDTV